MPNPEHHSHEQFSSQGYFDDEEEKKDLEKIPGVETVDEIIEREVNPEPKIKREVDPTGIRSAVKRSKQSK